MFRYLIPAVVVIALSACSTGDKVLAENKAVVTSCEPERQVKAASFGGLDTLGTQFYLPLTKVETGNIIFSPVSLAVALGMLQTGARSDSQSDLATLLGYDGETTQAINERHTALIQSLKGITDVTLKLANSVWLDPAFPVRPEYTTTLIRDYDAMATSANLGTEETMTRINQWGDAKSEGMIPNFLKKPLDSDTVFLLLNAVYFKGPWGEKFLPKNTVEKPFFLEDGSEVKVQMMHNSFLSQVYKTETFDAVRIPYQGGRIALYIFLPVTGVTATQFDSAFTKSEWAICPGGELVGEVELALPKFSFENTFDLKAMLNGMGLTRIFGVETADFSGISDKSLWVSFIQQVAKIIVNEEGTEAAAITVIGGNGITSVITYDVIPFVIDRPFAFTIQDEQSGTTLFMGRVRDPRM